MGVFMKLRSKVARHRYLQGALLASVLVLVVACASRPKSVLVPVAETSPTESQVEMLVATTRQKSVNPGQMFTGERALAPSFAEINVSIPPESVRKVGEIAWPKKLPSNPQTDFATLKAEDLPKEQAVTWLNDAVLKSPDRSVIVF